MTDELTSHQSKRVRKAEYTMKFAIFNALSGQYRPNMCPDVEDTNVIYDALTSSAVVWATRLVSEQAEPEITPRMALDALKRAMDADPDFARGWHANLAVMAQDAGGSYEDSQIRARDFMNRAFGVEGYEAKLEQSALDKRLEDNNAIHEIVSAHYTGVETIEVTPVFDDWLYVFRVDEIVSTENMTPCGEAFGKQFKGKVFGEVDNPHALYIQLLGPQEEDAEAPPEVKTQ